ncbi:hypothetical protein [Catellatospora bangladeshensis]|uniref:Uncharacterized protein n=1 Tax=Catellatospora bangladeshensis TaxID=310355 RepID=A0A8J3NLY6_9ACTN|nr:hypothetical protein [Catellatospora bangladeshensis]GIF84566.1 hypothetical protein Cba03nite_59150 [Catellatospora bangladeshensis]
MAIPVSDVEEAIAQAHHEEWARVVAALTVPEIACAFLVRETTL